MFYVLSLFSSSSYPIFQNFLDFLNFLEKMSSSSTTESNKRKHSDDEGDDDEDRETQRQLDNLYRLAATKMSEAIAEYTHLPRDITNYIIRDYVMRVQCENLVGSETDCDSTATEYCVGTHTPLCDRHWAPIKGNNDEEEHACHHCSYHCDYKDCKDPNMDKKK
jgi:hypothetical protein